MMARLRQWGRAFGLSQLLFWGAWWIGYLWLPEGLLRGGSIASQLPLEELGLWERTLGIIGWNGLWALLFAAGANLVRVRDWPMGFTAVLAMWGLYGLVLGTNSFAEPLPVRPAPSLLLVLQRSGFFELLAYLLVAGATAGLGRWSQDGWLYGKVRRLLPERLSPHDWLMLVAALLIMAFAAAREAIQWCAATGTC